MPWFHTPFRAAAWPAPCPICRQWTRGGFCGACVQRFAAPRPRCSGCGLAMAEDALTAASRQPPRCGQCIESPPPVEGTRVALDYGFPWDGLIGAMKFGGRPELATLLAPRLQQALAGEPEVDWVLPIPLHEDRARERGYNQSWELARRLGRPARHGLLLRWRATDTQSLQADAAARRANLLGAFMLSRIGSRELAGRRVALVDDVMTTGATAFEAARTLKQAGVAQVRLWILARAPQARQVD